MRAWLTVNDKRVLVDDDFAGEVFYFDDPDAVGAEHDDVALDEGTAIYSHLQVGVEFERVGQTRGELFKDAPLPFVDRAGVTGRKDDLGCHEDVPRGQISIATSASFLPRSPISDSDHLLG